MKNIILLLTLIIFTANGFSQQINSKKSIVNFKVPKAEGTITGMTGEVVFDFDDISKSKFNVAIDPNTIDTGNKKRDDHLRTEDFFYVEMFPKITFVSTSVSKTENGYSTEGTMKLHGVSQKVTINFTVSETGSEITLVGSLSINQLDYEMAKKDKQVDIEITCVLTK